MYGGLLGKLVAGSVSVLTVLLLSAGMASPVSAAESFAAGAARISEPCKIEFSARATGGNVVEQCDFESGRVLFKGPVMCYASSANMATFVWSFEKDGQAQYQQVWIVDNGAPGHGVPDEFHNEPESTYNPCPNISLDNPGTGPVLGGNFVVK